MKSTRILLTVLALLALVAGTAFATGTATETTEAPVVETTPENAEISIQDLFAPEATPMQGGPGCQGAPDPDCVCPTVYEPVCGCNGVTYSNSCYAKCDGVRQYTDGACA